MNNHELRIMIAGGGTGGHLFPALAIGEGLLAAHPATVLHYVGSKFGIEARVFSEKEFEYTLLNVRGFQRGRDLTSFARNLLFPGRVAGAYRQAGQIIARFDPQVVIGTGGYASGLPLLAATRRGIPTLIQEQNSFPGFTTRKLAAKVDRVCLAFADAADYLGDIQYQITGNPVRPGIKNTDRAAAAEEFQLDADRPTVLLFGGSQGSAVLNAVMAPVVTDLTRKNYQVLWQTGPAQYSQYSHLETIEVRLRPFIDRMDLAYALSDLTICRAGAITISELAICGQPAVLIPLPSAAADHQMKNARSFAGAGAAQVIRQVDLSPPVLLETINTLISDRDNLERMSQAAAGQALGNATENIVNEILKLAHA